MKVGAAIVLKVGCGMNDGRTLALRGEDASLDSLVGPSKRLRTVARGMAEGDGGEPDLRETSGNENVASTSSLATSRNGTGLRTCDVGTRGVVGEGVRAGDMVLVKADGNLNVNLIPPSSSSPTNVSSASSSSRTMLSPELVNRSGSSVGGDSTSTPTSEGSTNGGISSSSASTEPKKPLVNGLVVSGGAEGIGGESPMSSRHTKNLSTSS